MNKIKSKADLTLAEQIKASPGKAIALTVLGVCAVVFWGKAMFKEDEKAVRVLAAASTAANAAGGSASGGAANAAGASTGGARGGGAVPPLGPISSYESAMQRLETWRGPLGLHLGRQGEEIDISDFEDNSREEIEEIGLTLTGTIILGNTRFALFSGKRVKEGESIGRYVVEAIRAREIDVSDGFTVRTIQMSKNELQGNWTRN